LAGPGVQTHLAAEKGRDEQVTDAEEGEGKKGGVKKEGS